MMKSKKKNEKTIYVLIFKMIIEVRMGDCAMFMGKTLF